MTGVQTCALPILSTHFTATLGIPLTSPALQSDSFKSIEQETLAATMETAYQDPDFRASASVNVQQAAFATGVPPYIYAFHRYTRNSACLSITQDQQF